MMQAFCSTSLRVITGPALTTIILAPASAQAHWGHLGELAGHGHWIAAGLAAAAAVAVAGLAITRPRKECEATDEAVPDEPETNGEQSHA
jgi:hypothetical protein